MCPKNCSPNEQHNKCISLVKKSSHASATPSILSWSKIIDFVK